MPGGPALQVASEILDEGKKVCILAGRGALHARDRLAAMAERLGAPVCKPLPGNSEFSAGVAGVLGPR